MMKIPFRLAVALVPAFCIPSAPAQTQSAPTFSVTSIRQNLSDPGGSTCRPDQMEATPNGFHMTACPLLIALAVAYVPTDSRDPLGFIFNDRVLNAPDWLMTRRYDIEARIDDADAAAWKDPARRKQMLRVRMQSLLADRCKLVVHREMKDKSAYALVVAKNGPKLQPAESTDPAAIRAKHPDAMAIPGLGGMFGPGQGPGDHVMYGASMGTLAIVLSADAGKPVIDKTGLTGAYDIHIKGMQTAEHSLNAANANADTGNSIFFVVQDQLGLKLESQKNQVETLVIDHIEQPSPN
jgi:uncharacterized protein (TIGR03435 family)